MTAPPPHAPFPGEHDSDPLFTKGLPANLDAERVLLGSVILNYFESWKFVENLPVEIFSLEKHRRIFGSMKRLSESGSAIDRITLADELMKQGLLESVDGLGYLVSLDDGLPEIHNPSSYVRILQEKSALRAAIFTAQKVIDRCMIAQEDSREILDSAEEKFRSIRVVDPREGGTKSTEQIVAEFPGGIGAFLDPFQRVKGIQTGFTKLDDITGGLRGDEMIVLAARPAMGKSAIALNIAYNVAARTEPELMEKLQRGGSMTDADFAEMFGVSFFSLEMSGSSLVERLLCSAARVDQHKFRLGFLSKDERSALQRNLGMLSEVPIFIDDNPGGGLDGIAQKLRKDVRERGVKLGIIDYIGLMSQKAENRQNEVSKIARGIKLLTKELHIPIMALSQLNRAVDTRAGGSFVPQLSDLRDSGSIEQDADLVMFLVREVLYKKDRPDLKNQADLYVAKQRNGPIGKIPLTFLGQFTKFENRVEAEHPPEE